MKLIQTFTLALQLILIPTLLIADTNHTHEATVSPTPSASATSSATKKFKADKILREKMEKIIANSNNPKKILNSISEIFKSCKLTAEEDTALHFALIPILNGAKELQKNPANTEAKASIEKGIQEYKNRFY